ncbi:MAG: tetratricopeptide repeat protein [Gammaproteobacteria bacterium]|nr:tetratricopeptide repeat protein [Gammaproteobacteria bacterium]
MVGILCLALPAYADESAVINDHDHHSRAGLMMTNIPQSTVMPQENPRTTKVTEPMVEMLERIRQTGKQQAAEASFTLAMLAIERRDANAARHLIREAVQLRPSHPGYLRAATDIASNSGHFAEAEMYNTRYLKLAIEELGEEDIRVVILMDNLGTIYQAQQRYEKAEQIWRASLSLRERILGEMHPSLAPRLKDLAELSMLNQRFDETEKLLKRTIHILESNEQSDHQEITIAQHILADFYVFRQRTDEANKLYAMVLADWRSAPEQQRLRIAANLYKLGNEYLAQQRHEGARSQFELILGLLEEDFGPGHRYVRSAKMALKKMASEKTRQGVNKLHERTVSMTPHS